MDKNKRWHIWLIAGVLALTLYNIFPTVFFYSKPLNRPVGEATAQRVATEVATRVDRMERQAVQWLEAFCKNLAISPLAILVDEQDPSLVRLSFPATAEGREEASLAQHYLSKAGARIPFTPAQLARGPHSDEGHVLFVKREVGAELPADGLSETFLFSAKREADGSIAPLYEEVTYGRVEGLSQNAAGISEAGRYLQALQESREGEEDVSLLHSLSQRIVEIEQIFGIQSPLTQRYYASFTQLPAGQAERSFNTFVSRLETLKNHLSSSAEPKQKRQLHLLEQALEIVTKERALFLSGEEPLSFEQAEKSLQSSSQSGIPEVKWGGRNLFFEGVVVDWDADSLHLTLHPDLTEWLDLTPQTEAEAYRQDKLEQLLVNEVALLVQQSGEGIQPEGGRYQIALSSLSNSHSFLALHLPSIARQRSEALQSLIERFWVPTHSDLTAERYPIWDHESYRLQSPEEQQLGLVIYAPVLDKGPAPEGFRPSSLYVIAKGAHQLIERAQQLGSQEAGQMEEDLTSLSTLLTEEGFIGYPAAAYGFGPEYRGDYIFELDQYYQMLLAATREAFHVHGEQRFAILEFSTEKQRLLKTNEIETEIHEDLMKWRDEYQAARVALDPQERYEVPPPTRSVLWSNLVLSWTKYFRGDERKVLNWGLDLSGGKSVTIGLRDLAGRPVTDPDDLRQGINELYKRVNKMGVSEVEIRREGDHIILNFPGAQGISAAELVKASQMTFHIVNETFSPLNREIAPSVDRFLQEVWNEAVVTNRKDADSVNRIAWQHLGGGSEGVLSRPRSEAAQRLYEYGLRLADPQATPASDQVDDTYSSIAVWRGNEMSEWQGQSYPLMIVFHNYALEGTNLENVQAQYDPAKGNVLTFGIQRSGKTPTGKAINPRQQLYGWTSRYSESRIGGTPRGEITHGQGWRMAVILNGTVISAPRLIEPLRDSAMVTGHFSQREVNQLVADLKAGSLSYSPRILSERNVSPELGAQERHHGILAAAIGLCLVIFAMCGYYRFAGLVASVALLFNLLIMWGVLQNLGAALTLPGIAGIILTVGMAVDANVLVFERIREEFAATGRLSSSLQAGYRKAFSAIIDSNITTIIAAFILLHFDAGPIKGFAVTLIVGIIASMFTALFMTRTFFSYWVEHTHCRELKMNNFFKGTSFNFLKWARPSIVGSLVVILLGCSLLSFEGKRMFGMDFTGGYALNVTLAEQPGDEYRLRTLHALEEAGAPSQSVLVKELNQPNQLRIQMGRSLDQSGQVFYGMPEEIEEGEDPLAPEWERNPRIRWVVTALEKGGLEVAPASLATLDQQWNVISGQFSDSMRNQAILGLGLALLSILVYITIRFEWKFALSALLALVHDILITIGVMALFHALGMGVQIDLQVVGALMTIIGYSLNDTIVIFDRIREEARLKRKLNFADLINNSLNVTLNRTLITSGTTLLVLLALVGFGGVAIFDFALVMTLGVLFGTFSSLFIASPLLLFFHNRQLARNADQGLLNRAS